MCYLSDFLYRKPKGSNIIISLSFFKHDDFTSLYSASCFVCSFYALFNSISIMQAGEFPNHLSWQEPVLDSFPLRQTTKSSPGDRTHAREVTGLEVSDSKSLSHGGGQINIMYHLTGLFLKAPLKRLIIFLMNNFFFFNIT